PLGTVNVNGSGVAQWMISTLSGGDHNLTAAYADSAGNFVGATSSILVQHVDPAATTTTVVSSQPTSTYTQLVTFTATITGPAGVAVTGTVQFKDELNNNIGSAIFISGTSPRTAQVSTAALSATQGGPAHTITAYFTDSSGNL